MHAGASQRKGKMVRTLNHKIEREVPMVIYSAHITTAAQGGKQGHTDAFVAAHPQHNVMHHSSKQGSAKQARTSLLPLLLLIPQHLHHSVRLPLQHALQHGRRQHACQAAACAFCAAVGP
eukprot:282649-Pelagomonas_calceolata.AAC.2